VRILGVAHLPTNCLYIMISPACDAVTIVLWPDVFLCFQHQSQMAIGEYSILSRHKMGSLA
jgi:hypothetical protein